MLGRETANTCTGKLHLHVCIQNSGGLGGGNGTGCGTERKTTCPKACFISILLR